ncbi:hypothetical protein [Nocardia sp. NPDC005998]|uniref:hypothetical protein n=1 Tax=Nocardia sp. NPDC005998 TaxID=3156894 RepID=UPI00339DBD45
MNWVRTWHIVAHRRAIAYLNLDSIATLAGTDRPQRSGWHRQSAGGFRAAVFGAANPEPACDYDIAVYLRPSRCTECDKQFGSAALEFDGNAAPSAAVPARSVTTFASAASS